MTWSVQDPSLSHATSRAIRNVLGYPGAIGADLLMQILGLGAIMLILPVAVWGWRMLTHRTFDREALRLGCWILCTVIAAGFASCWPHGGAWPLPTGLGGVVGDALVRAPAVVFGPAGFVYRLVLGVILLRRHGARHSCSPAAGARARARTGADADRGRRRAVRRGGGRPRLGLAGLAVPRHDEREGADRLVLRHGLSLAGFELAARRRAFRSTARNPISTAAARHRWRREATKRNDEEEDETRKRSPVARAPRKKAAPRAAARKSSDKFELPSVSVLTAPKASRPPAAQQGRAGSQFARAGRRAAAISACAAKSSRPIPGPVVTLYELEPAPGIKSSRVIGLADDIARSMSALSARVAVVAGRNAIGIELPNAHREKVYLRELLTAKESDRNPSPSCRSASARPSAAIRSSSISRARRIC